MAPRLPGHGEDALIDTRNRAGDGTQVVSPLVDIQARLVNRSDVELFTVAADAPQYWRLTSLEAFDGSQWSQEKDYSDDDAIRGAGGREGLRQRFSITSLGSIWLPTAFAPVGISAEVVTRYNAETASVIRANGELFRGLGYTVVSEPPTATAAELAASTSSSAPGDEYLALPSDYPDEFRTLAAQITSGTSSAYDQAIALQDWFRANFTYNVNVPRGHSERAMESFLRAREGYCEQFAGTYAAFARSLGLAARVAVGFTPGEADEDGVLHVLGKHSHAWPEVWFDGIGWVLFEPTPGRGAPGAEEYTGVAPIGTGVFDGAEVLTNQDRGPATSLPGTNTSSNVVADVEGGPNNSVSPTPSPTLAPPASTTGGPSAAWWWTLPAILVAAALWALVLPGVMRALRAGESSSVRRTMRAWSDVEGALGGVGIPRPPAETPTEYAARAWRPAGCDRDALVRLAALTTSAGFDPDGSDDTSADEAEELRDQIVRIVHRRSSWTERILRRADPRTAALAVN
ncbi:MAG: DUF3488 and transglutaminase-like domain-containing protein [Ilumatobacteraceae bacterium]